MKSAQSHDLQCQWSSWRVVSPTRIALHMPEDNCCDMSGAIRLAQILLPGCRRIDTYAGDKRDTVYTLNDYGWYDTFWPVGHEPKDDEAS